MKYLLKFCRTKSCERLFCKFCGCTGRTSGATHQRHTLRACFCLRVFVRVPFQCACITSPEFLFLPLLLKSIINEIKQLRFWREGTRGFEAMLDASPRLIGPGRGDVRGPHELRIGEGRVNKGARRRTGGGGGEVSTSPDGPTQRFRLYAQERAALSVRTRLPQTERNTWQPILMSDFWKSKEEIYHRLYIRTRRSLFSFHWKHRSANSPRNCPKSNAGLHSCSASR